jgi:hypothetical protein
MKYRIKILNPSFESVEAGSLQEAGKLARKWVDQLNKNREDDPVTLCEIRPLLLEVDSLDDPDFDNAA